MENNKDERLFNEDNQPLSTRLKENLQNKLEKKQRSVKRGRMKTGKEKKSGQYTSKVHKSNKSTRGSHMQLLLLLLQLHVLH